MIRTQTALETILKTSLLTMAVALMVSSIAMADDYPNGTLTIPGGSLTINGTTLTPGSVSLSTKDPGFLFSSRPGMITISTNGTQLQIPIPKKSYTGNGNFMAYTNVDGLPYNIKGTYSQTVTASNVHYGQMSCNVSAQELIVNIDPTSLNPPCPCYQSNPNGQPGEQSPPPAVSGVIYLCPDGMGGSKQADSSNQCAGTITEKYETVTTVNSYEVDFYNPDGTSVATITSSDQPSVQQDQEAGTVGQCH